MKGKRRTADADKGNGKGNESLWSPVSRQSKKDREREKGKRKVVSVRQREHKGPRVASSQLLDLRSALTPPV